MSFIWRKHPILLPPTEAETAMMEPEQLVSLHTLYHSAIANSEQDPYRYGFILDNWRRCEELLLQHDAVMALGGNRASKTQLGAWLTIKCAMQNEGSLIVCFAQNAELSVLVQQSAIFHQLPAEYKHKTLGQDEYISYTKQNGFAGNSLIFPNGSRILFKTYSQYTQNQTVLEGLELGAFSPTAVNFRFNRPHFLVGDNKKIAAATCRIENPNFCHAVAQIEKLAQIISRLFQLLAQIIEEERIEHLQNIRHAGVVHTQCTALIIIGDGLDHAAENIGVDFFPIETADVD